MKKIFKWIKNRLPSKRRLIQIYAMLLFNANLKGFVTGEIYTGPLKNMCTPGLNCYSCPGASFACPMGALQNAIAANGKPAPYYIFGIIMLYGLLFGRWICGFLCPFGLIQELLHKIPTPKLKKSKVTRVLSYLKYVILAFFVGIIPISYALKETALPGFCKYICPAGTLEGALGLLSNSINESVLSALGPLFTWKFLLMVSFLVACIFIFRLFCRFICPLGALYGFFNKISLIGIKVDQKSCTDCGICVSKCKMDVRHVGDHECISCGECIEVCPTGAITMKGSKFVINPSFAHIPAEADEAEKEALRIKNQKAKRRNTVVRIVIATVMALVLGGTLFYFNFVDGNEDFFNPSSPDIETQEPQESQELSSEENESESQGSTEPEIVLPPIGTSVGNLCSDIPLDIFGRDDITNTSELRGKVVVLNFWFTTCNGCVKELPHFYDVAREYSDDVVIVAMHIEQTHVDVVDWISTTHPEWNDGTMLIAWDNDTFCQDLFKLQFFPTTIILDENGIITDKFTTPISRQQLVDAIEKAMEGYQK